MRPAVPVLTDLRPDPGPARDWVRDELANKEYQPSLLERVVDWFMDLVGRLLDAAGGLGLLSPVYAFLLLAVLVIGIAVVLARLRPDAGRAATRTEALLPDARVSAAEHRRLALRAQSDGRYDEAVVESLRAVAAGLVERGVLDDLPGATAREVTAQAASAFPDLAGRLTAAATVFDGVRYGEQHAGPERAAELLALEEAVRHARPERDATPGPYAAVPR